MKSHRNKNYHKCGICKETLTRTRLFIHYLQHKYNEYKQSFELEDEDQEFEDIEEDEESLS